MSKSFWPQIITPLNMIQNTKLHFFKFYYCLKSKIKVIFVILQALLIIILH